MDAGSPGTHAGGRFAALETADGREPACCMKSEGMCGLGKVLGLVGVRDTGPTRRCS